ncbi:MAG: hypothetical protein JNL74_10485, partial [Fibrobacteres bacterium]|nr:hypothetical protein [Fibrobacterota bacterium]
LVIVGTNVALNKTYPTYSCDALVFCGPNSPIFIKNTIKQYNPSIVLGVYNPAHSDLSLPDEIINVHLKTVDYKGVIFGGLSSDALKDNTGILKDFPKTDCFIVTHKPLEGDEVDRYILRTKPEIILHGNSDSPKYTLRGSVMIRAVSEVERIDIKGS